MCFGCVDGAIKSYRVVPLALKEQIVFPEISYDKIDKVRGMDIIVTTTAKTDEEARELLRLFGFPFAGDAEAQKAA